MANRIPRFVERVRHFSTTPTATDGPKSSVIGATADQRPRTINYVVAPHVARSSIVLVTADPEPRTSIRSGWHHATASCPQLTTKTTRGATINLANWPISWCRPVSRGDMLEPGRTPFSRKDGAGPGFLTGTLSEERDGDGKHNLRGRDSLDFAAKLSGNARVRGS